MLVTARLKLTWCRLWLTDLARQFPNAQLHGFDISSEQYIAAGFLPSNVSLRILDIFKDIPEEYVGKYDIVHARLLVQVVNQLGGDPLPVLKNLIKLLSMHFIPFCLYAPLIMSRTRWLPPMGRAG